MVNRIDEFEIDPEEPWDDEFVAELKRRSGDLEGAVTWEQLREGLLNEVDESTVQERDSH